MWLILSEFGNSEFLLVGNGSAVVLFCFYCCLWDFCRINIYIYIEDTSTQWIHSSVSCFVFFTVSCSYSVVFIANCKPYINIIKHIYIYMNTFCHFIPKNRRPSIQRTPPYNGHLYRSRKVLIRGSTVKFSMFREGKKPNTYFTKMFLMFTGHV